MGTKQVTSHRNSITESIERNREKYLKTSHDIHANPEIGNQEFFASRALSLLLGSTGFQLQHNIAGHETGFIARKSSGKQGPTIAFLAEYDALPGLGHACGHNLIGTISVAAAIALSETIEEIGGEIVVFGTPAEEGGPNGSAKASYVKAGLFNNIDAALMIHPSGKTATTSPSLAVDPLDFHFYGKSAHAAASPEEGINALDAVIQLYNGINALRQQLPSDVKIHGVITEGGKAPNIIPDYASARFFIRAATRKRCVEITEKVRNIAKGAALATGTTVKINQFQNEIDELLVTKTFNEVVAEELENLGEDVNRKERLGIGSTDAGNVSQVVPTVHPYIKIGPDNLVAHTNEFREAARSELGDKALVTSAKVLAYVAYRLITEEGTLDQIKEEFRGAQRNQ
ncbi:MULTISPECIES: M20 family metallopeptidase [Bacillus]|uniref:M20 family metallopeptidase n=1 Tax=Bacillus TaxID=1386 RepID=UPI0001A13421|nr:M20 family metallopeptidase [Bacillus pseudomycoides]EEM16230.1 N-acyl-L-amino acid amidohydrolase [Bacillus pseudomycoides DSM 12442]MED1594481.1 M20 family metallopeptidase [Bacillus pseudomycoides]MED4714166.1 M20 family metallopeptidase [Bacillus pseudomycoides]OOR52078.1 amidohydrolase [Bacillus pseudomycoides]PDY09733.1 amidohydrolase [Bacillus pseudomycoides]